MRKKAIHRLRMKNRTTTRERKKIEIGKKRLLRKMRKQKKQRKSEQNSRDKNYAYACQRERGNEKGKEKVREEKEREGC